MPNVQDVLRSRVQTTGIIETAFRVNKLTYRLASLDVCVCLSVCLSCVCVLVVVTYIIFAGSSGFSLSGSHSGFSLSGSHVNARKMCVCMCTQDEPLILS